MITIAMSTVVHTPRARVWRALTDPAEIIRWDERILSLEEAPASGGMPAPAASGATPAEPAHWRYRLGSVPVELVDRVVEVAPGQRLRHAMSIGSFGFEEIYTLADEGGPEHTRLSLRFASASNSIPVVGGAIDRFDLRRLATEIVDGNLRAIQKWCENHG